MVSSKTNDDVGEVDGNASCTAVHTLDTRSSGKERNIVSGF